MSISSDHVPIITFENVTFSYGSNVAVEDVSFSVEAGELVALIGPNGSGKTTLLKMAIGLLRPERGAVRLFGQDLPRFSDWRRIGYVPQRASAFNVRFPATVSDVVAYGEYRGFDPAALFRRKVSRRVEEALRTVEMWEHRRRLVSELSGGQQQRVLIGRAIVHHPDLLVLDEPTKGLDKPGQEQFYELLRKLRESRGVTVLLVSHDIAVAVHEASKVACIDRRLQFFAPPSALKDEDLAYVFGHPADLHSAALITHGRG